MCPIPNIVQPGGVILEPAPYSFLSWGLSTADYNVPVSTSTQYTFPYVDTTSTAWFTFTMIYTAPGGFSTPPPPVEFAAASWAVLIPFNSTGGFYELALQGIGQSNENNSLAYTPIGLAGPEVDTEVFGASTDSVSTAVTLTNVVTAKFMYLGNQNMNIQIWVGSTAAGQALLYSTNAGISGGGQTFGGWGYALSTVPAAISTQNGGQLVIA
jgi:hypothetical protein